MSAGWKEVYEGGSTDDDEEEQTLKDQKLPVLKQGEKLPIGSVRLTTGKTKPPAHFTEATLLAAMENPVKYMSSKIHKQQRRWEKPVDLAQLLPEQILLKNFSTPSLWKREAMKSI